MKSSSKYYLFIVSSLNHPVYRKVHKERRVLLKKYKIPYTVLINEKESDINDGSVSTLVPLESDEILYPESGYEPHMTQKFLNAVKLYFRSFSNYDEIPNYIVRINATVFIHFPALEKILNKLPKTKVLAGPCYTDDCSPYIVGMLMIFSKDVLWNILHSSQIFNKEIMKNADDVSLTILAEPYCKKYNLMHYFIYPDNVNPLYKPNEIKPEKNEKWFFRIRSPEPDRSNDVQNFCILREYFEHLQEKKKFQMNYLIVVVPLLIIFVCFSLLPLFLHFQEKKKNRVVIPLKKIR